MAMPFQKPGVGAEVLAAKVMPLALSPVAWIVPLTVKPTPF